MKAPSELPVESYSQHGEDKLLARIFAGKTHGVCVEVGAHDGVGFSNSLLFEKKGWNCILVEPNPDLCARIKVNRTAQLFECAASGNNGTATLKVGGEDYLSTIENDGFATERLSSESGEPRTLTVQTRTLDALLEESGLHPIDFVSIDVEGHEASVLKGFDLARWRPRVLVLENNGDLDEPEVKAITSRAGYRRVFQTGWLNNWYVHRDDAELNGFLKVLSISGEPLFGEHLVMIAKARTPRILFPTARTLWRTLLMLFPAHYG